MDENESKEWKWQCVDDIYKMDGEKVYHIEIQ
jgi:hypothetical protein